MGKKLTPKQARQLALKIQQDAEQRRLDAAEQEAKKTLAFEKEDYEFESEGC